MVAFKIFVLLILNFVQLAVTLDESFLSASLLKLTLKNRLSYSILRHNAVKN